MMLFLKDKNDAIEIFIDPVRIFTDGKNIVVGDKTRRLSRYELSENINAKQFMKKLSTQPEIQRILIEVEEIK